MECPPIFYTDIVQSHHTDDGIVDGMEDSTLTCPCPRFRLTDMSSSPCVSITAKASKTSDRRDGTSVDDILATGDRGGAIQSEEGDQLGDLCSQLRPLARGASRAIARGAVLMMAPSDVSLRLDELHDAVIVTMATARKVDVAADQIIRMVGVGNRPVSTARSVRVPLIMLLACMRGGAGCRIASLCLDAALIDVITVGTQDGMGHRDKHPFLALGGRQATKPRRLMQIPSNEHTVRPDSQEPIEYHPSPPVEVISSTPRNTPRIQSCIVG
jgi:hypothetical protein